MLQRVARLAIAAPRGILAVALLVMVAAAAFGIPGIKSLAAGDDLTPGAESSRAAALLSDKFGQGDATMIVTVSSPDGARGPAASKVGADITQRLKNSAGVVQVRSAWNSSPAAAASFISRDGKTGLILAAISGDATSAQITAKRLADELIADTGAVSVRAGGDATVYWQVNEQTRRDLYTMEAIALPLSFVVLIWVFGSVVAAALPVIVGVLAILGAIAALHAISLFTEVSVFVLNLTAAMGMALAVDYTLLILSRFRDERAGGRSRDSALVRTVTTAGRTVAFSALTVALSMATLVLFPGYFLKSFAYAGVAVVGLAAAAAIIVTPAAIVLLGSRLDSLPIRPLTRRILWGAQQARLASLRGWSWYRWTTFVMRHAVVIGVAVTAFLMLLGAPFRDVRWGFADDRILPTSASARQVGDQLRNDFPGNGIPPITAVLPDVTAVRAADLDGYAAALSRVGDVSSVSSPGGTFIDGRRAGPPSAPTAIKDGSAFLTVASSAPLYSAEASAQLDGLHAVAAPAGVPVLLGGAAQSHRDGMDAIASRLPWVLAIIAVVTLVLVFLLTRSVVLPVKTLLMSVLSLTAAFGALVWVFQQGHLGALGTTATGTLGVQLPILLFCIAFGLSMDYEMFLISRIREYWLASEGGPGSNEESVALGVAHTGRVITAAALIMSISFAALMTAQVSVMRLFGLGLTLAVLVDATLVRMMLVPAFMRLLGPLNWWPSARQS